MKKKILFIVGSINQTTQMHAISNHLRDYDCYFSQYFSDGLIVGSLVRAGLLDNTILGGQFRKRSEAYLSKHNLKNDYAASRFSNQYDLIITCSDLIVPNVLKDHKLMWVQEGMTDPITPWTRIVKALHLPAYLSGGTALNGTSNKCDVYCVASEGYVDHFKSLGAWSEKLVVTGIPNFDNAASFLINDFPYRDYVLVATSDIRETLGSDDRIAFLKNAIMIANGRRLIFKLHPNENIARATREIKLMTPADTLVFSEGDINPMIANCSELITQYSTVVYLGMSLGKKVHSYFDVDELRKKVPLQNGGRSAVNIATIAKAFVEYKGAKEDFPHKNGHLFESQVVETLRASA